MLELGLVLLVLYVIVAAVRAQTRNRERREEYERLEQERTEWKNSIGAADWTQAIRGLPDPERTEWQRAIDALPPKERAPFFKYLADSLIYRAIQHLPVQERSEWLKALQEIPVRDRESQLRHYAESMLDPVDESDAHTEHFLQLSMTFTQEEWSRVHVIADELRMEEGKRAGRTSPDGRWAIFEVNQHNFPDRPCEGTAVGEPIARYDTDSQAMMAWRLLQTEPGGPYPAATLGWRETCNKGFGEYHRGITVRVLVDGRWVNPLEIQATMKTMHSGHRSSGS